MPFKLIKIFPNKNDVDLPRCDTVGISGISAGLAGLISAQKIINYSLAKLWPHCH